MTKVTGKNKLLHLLAETPAVLHVAILVEHHVDHLVDHHVVAVLLLAVAVVSLHVVAQQQHLLVLLHQFAPAKSGFLIL